MIGASAAVAVRQERQKQNRQQVEVFGTSGDSLLIGSSINSRNTYVRRSSRPVRPNNLPLETSTSISSISGSSPSYLRQPFLTGTTPVQIPLSAEQEASDYCCKHKIPILHFIVISLIIGITLLVVGLAQLKPNADLYSKKFVFLYSAAACFAVGFFLMFIRCIRLYRFRKQMNSSRKLPNETSDYSLLTTFDIMVDREQNSPFDSIALLQQKF